MNSETITISKSEYEYLIETRNLLNKFKEEINNIGFYTPSQKEINEFNEENKLGFCDEKETTELNNLINL